MARVELRDLTKRYGEVTAVDRVSIDVADGELLVLLGPSGSGKSTILKLVAGIEAPDGGEVWVGNERVDNLLARHRDVAMVFQSYALYPHMSVAANLAFPLRSTGVARDETRKRVADVAELLGIEGLLDRRPGQLSGGQQQRVALGRAIVRRPKAFLMDEPLSNLDAKLRARTRLELTRLHERIGATTVYVTHDQ
ncbi:MAG: glycerol-3-phosphate ABC transporter ATP-binding protein, partial [Candidatus Aeolococcus gillhamiae]